MSNATVSATTKTRFFMPVLRRFDERELPRECRTPCSVSAAKVVCMRVYAARKLLPSGGNDGHEEYREGSGAGTRRSWTIFSPTRICLFTASVVISVAAAISAQVSPRV